jgi:hypothetical protein
VTYPAGGENTHFYCLTGAEGTTVDLDEVTFSAEDALTPPVFEQSVDRYHLWANAESEFDLSATDRSGSVSLRATRAPGGCFARRGHRRPDVDADQP